jgi:hypothetical protein
VRGSINDLIMSINNSSHLKSHKRASIISNGYAEIGMLYYQMLTEHLIIAHLSQFIHIIYYYISNLFL